MGAGTGCGTEVTNAEHRGPLLMLWTALLERRESAKKVAADEVTTILARRHTGHDDRARYRKVGLPGSRHGRAVRFCRPSTAEAS